MTAIWLTCFRGKGLGKKNKVLIAEILHLLTCSLSHYLWCVFHPNWCRMSPINNMGNRSPGIS